MSSPIDIIRKANAKEPMRIAIELPGGIKCWMHLPNRYQITDIRQKLYRMAYAEASDLGLVGKNINDAEWEANRSLPIYADTEKPSDLAEQYAQQQSIVQIIHNLVPSLIRDDAGAELFKSIQEKRAFLEIVRDNQELEAYIISKWNELFSIRKEAEEAAKNS